MISYLQRILEYGKNLLSDHNYRIIFMSKCGFFNHLSDEEYLKLLFAAHMDYPLNLETPQTFNEKLQWLKIHDRNPEYTKMVDKYEVKKYVADIIGEEYIIPTLGVWDRFEDIDFSQLPDQFVLKCTHDSGGIVICKDKSKLDIKAAKNKINKSLKSNYYYVGREWPYKNVKPRIIAEEYREDSETLDLRDYKFFVFNGVSKAMFIATDRQTAGTEIKFDFFDMNFNHLPFQNGHPNAEAVPLKPKNFNKMKELAEKIGDGFPHVRIDFYEANNKVYFGEITFYHFSGFHSFVPIKWDYVFGQWIELGDFPRN